MHNIYELKFIKVLKESWADWFDGTTFSHHNDGTTILTGEVMDQAVLPAILNRIARVAGVLYLLVMIHGMFSLVYVVPRLFVALD